MIRFATALSFVLPAFMLFQASAAETILFDMDSVQHRPGEAARDGKRVPVGTLESVPGKVNQAVRFNFAGDVGPGFMTAGVKAGPEWDIAGGFSFWVKGDGSTNFGGIELIDRNDFALRYGFCFSIDSTNWTKVTVPWGHMIPELAAPLVNSKSGYAPSQFGNLWFGKWFYWRDYPAHSFCIDQVMLETDLPPPIMPRPSPGLKRFREKLSAHKPVTIVTMGDSLTDKRHWANREVLWAELVAQELKTKFGCDARLVNPAIGGTTLSQNLVLLPRWLRQAPHPDLVTIWFGGNDWDSGVRGARLKEYLAMGIDRIRQLTEGSADILVLTTCPGFKRFDTMTELEGAQREVSKEQQAELVDIAAEFRKAGSADAALQKGYWAWDNVHLGTKGHMLTADLVLKTIAQPQ